MGIKSISLAATALFLSASVNAPKILLLITLALSANSYGGNLEEYNSYSGSKANLEWLASESRFIDGVGIHDVNTFKNTVGNNTPYDAYARSELNVTGSGGCTKEEIDGITGCNRTGQGSFIPEVGFALYDDKFEATYEADSSYLYQVTVTPKSSGIPVNPTGFIPISFSYEITAGVWIDSISMAPTYNGDANVYASASLELYEFTSSTPILSESVVASTYMMNNGRSNIFDTDVKSTTLELSVPEGNTLSLILNSYISADLWSLEFGDSMNISADAYADPVFIVDPSWEFANDYEVSFGMADNVFVHETNLSAVPVPASMWLFGSGLVGLISIARRKKS